MAFCEWKKNKVWLWRAIDGISRRSLGWQLGSHGDASAKKLIKKVNTGKCMFVTDEWGGFFRLLPEDRHYYGKDLTFPIEASNRDLRHRLARFTRRTKASSRSRAMVEVSLLLFFICKNEKNLEALLSPFLALFS